MCLPLPHGRGSKTRGNSPPRHIHRSRDRKGAVSRVGIAGAERDFCARSATLAAHFAFLSSVAPVRVKLSQGHDEQEGEEARGREGIDPALEGAGDDVKFAYDPWSKVTAKVSDCL